MNAPLRHDAQSARWSVIITAALTFAVMLPSLAVRTGFGGDDWVWIWILQTEGFSAIRQHLTEAAHPGYIPVFDVLLWLGGENAFRLARALVIPIHLANGFLVWRIFSTPTANPSFAATLAILYLTAPFMGGLDQSFVNAVYDVFVFFYLLSILLSRTQTGPATVFALLSELIGLSIETLAALEPIRWWSIYQQERRLGPTVRRALLYLAPIAIVALARIILFYPQGAHAGYNAIRATSLEALLDLVRKHLLFFLDFHEPLQLASSLVQNDSILFSALLAVGATAAAVMLARAGSGFSSRALAGLTLLAAIILAVGIAPYAAVGRFPVRGDFEVRTGAISQFGALIFAAIAIQLLWSAKLRALAMAGAVFVFSAGPLQQTKWMLFEQLVLDDYRHQLGGYLATAEPQMLIVEFSPRSYEFLYRRRWCFNVYENNISLELAGQRHGSFVWDSACGPGVLYPDPTPCRFTGYRHEVCPRTERAAKFDMDLQGEPFLYFERFRLLDFIHGALTSTPLRFGRLEVSDRQQPDARAVDPARYKAGIDTGPSNTAAH